MVRHWLAVDGAARWGWGYLRCVRMCDVPCARRDAPCAVLTMYDHVLRDYSDSQFFFASRRGKKGFESSRDKNEIARAVVGRGGEKSLLCDPGSELRLGGREKKKGEDNNGMKKKTKKKNVIMQCTICDIRREVYDARCAMYNTRCRVTPRVTPSATNAKSNAKCNCKNYANCNTEGKPNVIKTSTGTKTKGDNAKGRKRQE